MILLRKAKEVMERDINRTFFQEGDQVRVKRTGEQGKSSPARSAYSGGSGLRSFLYSHLAQRAPIIKPAFHCPRLRNRFLILLLLNLRAN